MEMRGSEWVFSPCLRPSVISALNDSNPVLVVGRMPAALNAEITEDGRHGGETVENE